MAADWPKCIAAGAVRPIPQFARLEAIQLSAPEMVAIRNVSFRPLCRCLRELPQSVDTITGLFWQVTLPPQRVGFQPEFGHCSGSLPDLAWRIRWESGGQANRVVDDDYHRSATPL